MPVEDEVARRRSPASPAPCCARRSPRPPARRAARLRRRLVRGVLTAGILRAAGACFGDDPDNVAMPPSTPDAGPSDGGGASDGSASSSCPASEPFGPLESLGPAINTVGEEYPGRFSADMLAFVFARQVIGSGHVEPQLFIARRSSRDAPFQSANPVFALLTGEHDQEPTSTPWGAILFHRGEQGSTKLMVAVPNEGGFAAPVPLGNAINAERPSKPTVPLPARRSLSSRSYSSRSSAAVGNARATVKRCRSAAAVRGEEARPGTERSHITV